MTLWFLLGVSGFLAGAINAIAGGGSLVSFPALLLTGMPAVAANATNSLAVWPGSITAVLAYRKLLGETAERARLLAVPSVLGSAIGSYVLLHTSERAFRTVVPFLILFACALLLSQEQIAARLRRSETAEPRGFGAGLFIAQFVIAIYGGYFGAGMGILMLAAMAIALPESLQHANALKVLLSLLINGVSVAYFLSVGAARLPEAAFMAVTALAGGYAGARIALRMPPKVMRLVVSSYGIGVALYMLVTQR